MTDTGTPPFIVVLSSMKPIFSYTILSLKLDSSPIGTRSSIAWLIPRRVNRGRMPSPSYAGSTARVAKYHSSGNTADGKLSSSRSEDLSGLTPLLNWKHWVKLSCKLEKDTRRPETETLS